MRNYKQEAAAAALAFIQPNQIIGLGAGSTISYMATLIYHEIPFKDTLKFISPSYATRSLLHQYQLSCADPSFEPAIDQYFDSCDQVDLYFNALKSGGGIHTQEKIMASMASTFTMLVDAEKLVPELNAKFPLCIEILPPAASFVSARMLELFPGCAIKFRSGVMSDNGNFLADVLFDQLPALEELNIAVKMIPGVVEHSLFYRLIKRILVAGEEGVKEYNK